MQLILHDLEPDYLKDRICENEQIISARVKATPCKGCFKCWTKYTGHCKYGDSLEHIGAAIGNSDDIIIISKLTYGGYSSIVKRIFDRGISISLPFFTYRKGEIHHFDRYHKTRSLFVIFYGSGTALEQETAREYVSRHAINLNADVKDVVFLEDESEIGGVLK